MHTQAGSLKLLHLKSDYWKGDSIVSVSCINNDKYTASHSKHVLHSHLSAVLPNTPLLALKLWLITAVVLNGEEKTVKPQKRYT